MTRGLRGLIGSRLGGRSLGRGGIGQAARSEARSGVTSGVEWSGMEWKVVSYTERCNYSGLRYVQAKDSFLEERYRRTTFCCRFALRSSPVSILAPIPLLTLISFNNSFAL